MFEVEIKAVISNERETLEKLKSTVSGEFKELVYHDYYFDTNNRRLNKEEKELRIRNIHSQNGEKIKLTFKDSPIEKTTRSKPEYEVELNDFEEGKIIVEKMGYQKTLDFIKKCKLINTSYSGKELEICLTEIEELDQKFIEIECQTEIKEEVDSILDTLYKLMKEIGIREEQLTNEYYTDLVWEKR